jgi:selenide,water dikinase
MEDAALLRPEPGRDLVFTVDFITPVVDGPEDYGAIAAANALSDVYAMGGEPQVALAICGFPEGTLPRSVLERILRGGQTKAAEAGCAIVGGHTILDPELKYGLCVLGTVDPAHRLTHSGARPGDRLVLTKPLGFGIASQAIKQGSLSPPDTAAAVAAMATLNKGAKDAALAAGARAATDVTGFGLLGHLHHLLLGAKLAARLWTERVPVLPFVRALAGAGVAPGGSKRNLAYAERYTASLDALDDTERLLLADAQTSGGLLIAVPRSQEARLLSGLQRARTLASAVIGELTEGSAGHIEVTTGPHGESA